MKKILTTIAILGSVAFYGCPAANSTKTTPGASATCTDWYCSAIGGGSYVQGDEVKCNATPAAGHWIKNANNDLVSPNVQPICS